MSVRALCIRLVVCRSQCASVCLRLHVWAALSVCACLSAIFQFACLCLSVFGCLGVCQSSCLCACICACVSKPFIFGKPSYNTFPHLGVHERGSDATVQLPVPVTSWQIWFSLFWLARSEQGSSGRSFGTYVHRDHSRNGKGRPIGHESGNCLSFMGSAAPAPPAPAPCRACGAQPIHGTLLVFEFGFEDVPSAGGNRSCWISCIPPCGFSIGT